MINVKSICINRDVNGEVLEFLLVPWGVISQKTLATTALIDTFSSLRHFILVGFVKHIRYTG